MKCVLGFDGGGTKTECVALNEAGAILARGRGPASNPTRIGFPAALAGIRETAVSTINSTRPSLEVIAVCAGLAGTARPENRDQMRQFLKKQFPHALVDVRTDLELMLSTMPAGPAIVLVAGTGSGAIGRDPAGLVKREGGLGPANSDEGSAFAIGRAAIAASRFSDSSMAAKELARAILRHLGCSTWSEVDAKSEMNADDVYPRVFPVVAAAADAGNSLAQSLLSSAAEKLAAVSYRLAEALDLLQQKCPLGKVGGTIGRSRFFDDAMDHELHRCLPQAIISSPSAKPAEVAAWIALQLLRSNQGVAP
jgi:N-acetylglucosamine kinase-like BadF-type ATPase